MKHLLILAGASILMLVAVSPLSADDFMPSPARGDPLSYLAIWEFDIDPGPGLDIPPDYVEFWGDGIHELFDAVTHMHRDPERVFWDPAGYLYTLGMPGELAFFLNNWVDDYPYKHIWVQVTYTTQNCPPCVSHVLGADSSLQWPDPYMGYPMYRIEHDPMHFVEYWQIQRNPNMEYVYLNFPAYTTIDEVVIDTWSTVSEVGNEETTWSGVKSLYR